MDAYDASSTRRSSRGADPMDQRLDRWVSTGRQFVDGVVGARPGSRSSGRPGERPGERRGASRPRLDGLGRWVEDRLDWLLEDGDDWREPWQEAPPPGRRADPAEEPAPGRQRRGLEAISRRGPAALPPRATAAGPDDDWPDEASFSVPRWRRPTLAAEPPRSPEAPASRGPLPQAPISEVPVPDAPGVSGSTRPSGRPLPRSSRRR